MPIHPAIARIIARRRRRILIVVSAVAVTSFLDHAIVSRHRPSDEGLHDRTATLLGFVDDCVIKVAMTDDPTTILMVQLCGLRQVEPDEHDAAEPPPRSDWIGKRVRLLLDSRKPTRDAAGHLIAYVWLEDGSGEMLNETLIRLGYVRASPECAHAYKLRFRQIEERAMRQHLGFWSSEQGPLRPRRAGPRN